MNADRVRLLLWQSEDQNNFDLAWACRTVLAVMGDYATARERVQYDEAKAVVAHALNGQTRG